MAPRDGGREAELSPARAGRLNSQQCREVVLFPLGNLETAPTQLAFEKFLIISSLLLPGEFCDSLVDSWGFSLLVSAVPSSLAQRGFHARRVPSPRHGAQLPWSRVREPNSLQQGGMLGH